MSIKEIILGIVIGYIVYVIYHALNEEFKDWRKK